MATGDPPVVTPRCLVAEAVWAPGAEVLQRLFRQLPARRGQLHAEDVARSAEEELQSHLSRAHAWLVGGFPVMMVGSTRDGWLEIKEMVEMWRAAPWEAMES